MKERVRVHYIQHVPHENLGCIGSWLEHKRYKTTATHPYQKSAFPSLLDIDWLIVLGGPMNVDQTTEYPWLTAEKHFIENCIKQNKKVLGICLGAQMIADVLGTAVTRNPYKEIGWFPVELLLNATHPLTKIFPQQFEAFHWHGDTFEMPANSLSFAKSQACQNQGFIYQDRVIGLQFHLEATVSNVRRWIEQGEQEWKGGGPYVQSPEEMLADYTRFQSANQMMHNLLDYSASGGSGVSSCTS